MFIGCKCLLELLPPDLTLYRLLFDIVPVLTLVSAAIYYVYIARNAEKSRKAQLFMSLYEQFKDYEWMQRWTDKFYQWNWKDFDDYLEKYGPEKNPKAFSSYNSTCAFFEGIGVLLKNKLIDIEIVTQLIYTPVVWMWEKTESITKGYRERYNAPQLWEYFEYLVNEMRKEKKLTLIK